MKRLATLATLSPGAVLAHGGHAPILEPAHTMTHAMGDAGPILGALVIALAIGLALAQRWRS